MSQPTDIVLDGAGYMVQPGSYRRGQDGIAEGRTGRIVMRDFFGGQLRAFQLERDRAHAGIGVGPTLNGQGVWPWPAETTATLDTAWPTPFRNTRLPQVSVDNYVFFGLGQFLLRTVAHDAASWAPPTVAYDFGAGKSITGLFNAKGEVGVCLGGGLSVQAVPAAGGATTNLNGTGEFGRFGVGYAGHAIYAMARTGGATETLHLTGPNGTDARMLDHWIVNMGLYEGKVVVATKQSLYTFSGRADDSAGGKAAWSGEFVPFHNEAWSEEWDDYPFLLGYGGKLYTWVNKQCVEWNPNGDRAGGRATGLEGLRCYGAAIAGGYLVVCIETVSNRSQLWAWDGAGWWLIRDTPVANFRNVWPVGLAGAGNWDLMVMRDGSRTIDLFRLIWRDNTRHALSALGEFTTAMLDAGERDKDKAWRKVGAVFAAPAVTGAVPDASTCDISLLYNPGGTSVWTQAQLVTKAGNTIANMNFTLEADIASNAVVSRFLQLKATWQPNGAWAPILTALWAEYETLDSPARRRKWSFVVAARDQTLDRAGALLPRTGRQLIAGLWQAWQTGRTLAFRDQDYDADPSERRVRIVGIDEQVPKPSDAGLWGASLLKLTLVEV